MVFPSKIRLILGIRGRYGAHKRESGLSGVSLRACGPLALIPVNGKNEIPGARFGPKMAAAHAPGVVGRRY